MPELQSIEIDLDIHKLIEAERTSFNEPAYIALRRLLKLPPPRPEELKPVMGKELAWTDEGVNVPHGSLARMEYLRGRQVYEGQFLNGRLVVNGQKFRTLSAAAVALAETKRGKKTSLNGWNYWKVQVPGETQWRSLSEMRAAVK
jgi:hypothetical protein